MQPNPDNKITSPDLLLIVLAILVASISNILLKIAGEGFTFQGDVLEIIFSNWKLLLGYSLYIFPSLITVYLFKKYRIGIIQSLLASVYVVTPLLAHIIGIEQLNLLKIIGTMTIALGVAVISLSDISAKKDNGN